MKKMFILSMLLSGAMIFALVSCGGGGSNSGRTPKSMTKKMMSYIEKEEYENAIRYMLEISDQKKKLSNLSEKDKIEYESTVTLYTGKIKAGFMKKKGIKKIEILDEIISDDGNSAEVKTKLHYGDGTVDEDSEKFVKVDGIWYYKK